MTAIHHDTGFGRRGQALRFYFRQYEVVDGLRGRSACCTFGSGAVSSEQGGPCRLSRSGNAPRPALANIWQRRQTVAARPAKNPGGGFESATRAGPPPD
jgi:hypothetical protein